jgi:hypothetical protein
MSFNLFKAKKIVNMYSTQSLKAPHDPLHKSKPFTLHDGGCFESKHKNQKVNSMILGLTQEAC